MSEDMTRQIVGIADLQYARDGILTSYGFGSCVGIVMYDPQIRLAGLLHIMLPDSKAFSVVDNPLKFADTGIAALRQGLLMKGASAERIVSKIAGGASVYRDTSGAGLFDVGRLNAERVKTVLKSLSIPILAEDLGGHFSRTIDYDVRNDRLAVKRISQQGIQNIVL